MAITRLKVWLPGDVLTAAALNAEFDNLADNLIVSPVAVAEGGTGATTAAGARTNLGLGTIATVNSPVPIANGGTASTTAGAARTALGLGDLAVENASAVPSVTFAANTIYDEVVSLTDAATTTMNLSLGNLFTWTIGGNRTLDITNLARGVYILWLIQDATGSRTVTWDAAQRWPGGTEPTLSTAANAVDIITITCDGTNCDSVASIGFA